jgi:hypothetical protein
MAHSLSGIDQVVWGVADLAAAEAVLARLGFAPSLRFAQGGLKLALAPPAGLCGITLGSRDLTASRAALGLEDDILPAEATPGLRVGLRQAETLADIHPNTVIGIASVTLVVAQPERLIPAYDRLFGLFACTPTDEMVTVHTGQGMLFLVTQDSFDHLHPQLISAIPEPPSIAALSLTVADLAIAESVLTANRVKFRRGPDTLAIDPSEVFGIGVEFLAQ